MMEYSTWALGGGASGRQAAESLYVWTATARLHAWKGKHPHGRSMVTPASGLTWQQSSAIMLDMTEFVPGLRLSRLFYEKAVRIVLDAHFPEVPHSAALIGPGSDVMGFDTERSTDHHWGPRLQLFLRDEDYTEHRAAIKETLGNRLPLRFMGYPTNFRRSPDDGNAIMEDVTGPPMRHLVETHTVQSFVEGLLGSDPLDEIEARDWLTFPQQNLLILTGGGVFYDGLGELNRLRDRFHYYPKDVWLYLVACQWMKISQEEPFAGRCAELGDELGSQVITARMVREVMRLCYLLEKTYIPYGKWLGTAFSRLGCAKRLTPILTGALSSRAWEERETWLTQAYELVADLHNSLGITRHVEAKVSGFHNRPYGVIHAERFAAATREAIEDEAVRAIRVAIGSVDQFGDSTDFLCNARILRRTEGFFAEPSHR